MIPTQSKKASHFIGKARIEEQSPRKGGRIDMTRFIVKGTGIINCGGTIASLGQEEYSKRYSERVIKSHIKLGKLEDIEEEFGISLVKLLSAKKVYYMTWNPRKYGELIIRETEKLFINLTDRTIEYYEDEYDDFTYDLRIQNYGKKNTIGGWAFTKEELR